MNNPGIMQMFADVGAIVSESHFVYSSGRHSSVYINKDALYLHTQTISALCQLMASPYSTEQVDAVVGPVLGGIVLSQWVAHHLNTSRAGGETLAIYAEKGSDSADKQFFFNRGYDIYIPGKNILVVEDVLTTGGSTRETMEVAKAAGAQVVGAASIVNRSGGAAKFDVPLESLLDYSLPTYEPEKCPLCAKGLPVVKPGSRQVTV